MKKSFIRWSALALIAAATACAKSSPTQPTGNNTPAAATTTTSTLVSGTQSVTVSAPTLLSPADSAQIKFSSQPITLTVGNAVTTSSTAPTYTFEVASDSGFSSIKSTKSGVSAGANGQTSVTLDKLAGASTYYWRARIAIGSAPGPNSKTRSFTVGPEVVLQAPVLATPGSNATVGDQPTLTVNNVQRTGPAGTIVYTFQLSQSSDFSSLVYSGTSTEQPNTVATAHTVTAHLDDKTTYWWRVQAADPSNAVTSPMSIANPFLVQLFDMRKAVIWNNPADLGSWAETAKITYADTGGPYIVVDFDRRTGPGRWPDVGFGSGSLEYTLGMCFNLDGQWHCSAAIQFWYGRELEAGGPPQNVGIDWYYDARWGRMIGHQPAQGEIIGIFVAAGNLRDSGNVITKERSNVLLMPFGSSFSTSALKRLPFAPR